MTSVTYLATQALCWPPGWKQSAVNYSASVSLCKCFLLHGYTHISPFYHLLAGISQSLSWLVYFLPSTMNIKRTLKSVWRSPYISPTPSLSRSHRRLFLISPQSPHTSSPFLILAHGLVSYFTQKIEYIRKGFLHTPTTPYPWYIHPSFTFDTMITCQYSFHLWKLYAWYHPLSSTQWQNYINFFFFCIITFFLSALSFSSEKKWNSIFLLSSWILLTLLLSLDRPLFSPYRKHLEKVAPSWYSSWFPSFYLANIV